MQRVVSFYEKLPRGPAPDVQAKGLLGRYQARYFGKNPSAARKFLSLEGPYDSARMFLQLIRCPPALIHLIGFLLALGYANNYYFHLRVYTPKYILLLIEANCRQQGTIRTMHTRA